MPAQILRRLDPILLLSSLYSSIPLFLYPSIPLFLYLIIILLLSSLYSSVLPNPKQELTRKPPQLVQTRSNSFKLVQTRSLFSLSVSLSLSLSLSVSLSLPLSLSSVPLFYLTSSKN
jgi:hypothetical protein